MTQFKYSPKQNFKFTPHTTRVFRQTGTRSVLRNSNKKREINNSTNSRFNLLNMVFLFAGIFSVVSLGLIFTPNIMTTKIVKAQIPKSQPVTIVTNFNSQEYKSINKGKSFLQPIQVSETIKK